MSTQTTPYSPWLKMIQGHVIRTKNGRFIGISEFDRMFSRGETDGMDRPEIPYVGSRQEARELARLANEKGIEVARAAARLLQ